LQEEFITAPEYRTMRTHRAVFYLFVAALFVAITAPLSIESAPAPQTDTEAVIEFVKPPAVMSLEKFRDQQISYLRSEAVHEMVLWSREDFVETASDNRVVRRYTNWLALSIVKEQKVVEAFLPKREFDPRTGRTMTVRQPALKEEKKLEAWLNKNLRIRPTGKRFIRISFAAGSMSEQAAIINALLRQYRDCGPHVDRKLLLEGIERLRGNKIVNHEKRRLASFEADLPRLKKEVEKDKANLGWKLGQAERQIASLKEFIKECDDEIRKGKAELENLPPEPPRIRWAKK
jgi:hypothetical protein